MVVKDSELCAKDWSLYKERVIWCCNVINNTNELLWINYYIITLIECSRVAGTLYMFLVNDLSYFIPYWDDPHKQTNKHTNKVPSSLYSLCLYHSLCHSPRPLMSRLHCHLCLRYLSHRFKRMEQHPMVCTNESDYNDINGERRT